MNAASKIAVPQTRRCGSTCGTTTGILTARFGSSMPTWMTLNTSTGVLTVAPTDNNQIGPYVMTITMSTPDSGIQTYSTVTLTI